MLKKIFLIAGALNAIGCESPLFNHSSAEDQTESFRGVLPDRLTGDCPLSFQRANYCASLTWIVQPSSEDPASFQLRFWSKETANASGPFTNPPHTVFVKLWMPDMGHGSSPVEIKQLEAGVFDVTRVSFVMPGRWQVLVQLKDGRNIVEESVVELDVQ